MIANNSVNLSAMFTAHCKRGTSEDWIFVIIFESAGNPQGKGGGELLLVAEAALISHGSCRPNEWFFVLG